jgi:hypothetical protein
LGPLPSCMLWAGEAAPDLLGVVMSMGSSRGDGAAVWMMVGGGCGWTGTMRAEEGWSSWPSVGIGWPGWPWGVSIAVAIGAIRGEACQRLVGGEDEVVVECRRAGERAGAETSDHFSGSRSESRRRLTRDRRRRVVQGRTGETSGRWFGWWCRQTGLTSCLLSEGDVGRSWGCATTGKGCSVGEHPSSSAGAASRSG